MKKEKISDLAVEYILTRNNRQLRDLKEEIVAQVIGVPGDNLGQRFKRDQKISLGDFISREKIHRAIFILETQHDKSIADLSKELGFTSKKEFATKFENYLAISPAGFRDLKKTAKIGETKKEYKESSIR